MIRKYAEIFCWKNVSSFCIAKATHIFSAKNIRILYIESAKIVNEMTLNDVVKLIMLWTTGPWSVLVFHYVSWRFKGNTKGRKGSGVIYWHWKYRSACTSTQSDQCLHCLASLGGSVGCAVRLETRRSRVQPPSRSATFFRGDWSWNIFYGHSLPSADSRRAVVSFWWKNVHNTG